MKTKHTPGPWQIIKEEYSGDHLVYIKIGNAKKQFIITGVYATKHSGSSDGERYKDEFGTWRNKATITEEECRANASLIAAAPELLAACKFMLAVLGDDHAGSMENWPEVVQMLASIAKAEGGAS